MKVVAPSKPGEGRSPVTNISYEVVNTIPFLSIANYLFAPSKVIIDGRGVNNPSFKVAV